MNKKVICMFTAPYSFLDVKKVFFSTKFKFILKEIWNKKDLRYNKKIAAWIVNPGQRFIIDKAVLKFFPNLKILISPSTGINHINKKDCREKGIKVFSLLNKKKDLNQIRASSEFSFLLILNSFRRLDRAINEIDNYRWRDREDFLRGREIASKKIGLIGLGRIGINLANWLKMFGSEVSYFDPAVKNKKFTKKNIKQIFKTSDLICLCCTLNEKTKNMVNFSLLRNMKKNAILVNTSRGEIINEKELLLFLKKRKDIFFTSDVMSKETTGKQFNSKLIDLHKKRRILLSPHIAGATIESQLKAAKISLKILNNLNI